MSLSEENAGNTQAPTDNQQLTNLEAVRDLFAKSHDYLAQASHPGHRAMEIVQVLSFLKFQYDDFKLRAETLKKQIESRVDVEAAEAATKAVLEPQTAQEAPKG